MATRTYLTKTTNEDNLQLTDNYLVDIYNKLATLTRRGNGTGASGRPIIMPAYGETTSQSRDRLFSSFAMLPTKLREARVAVTTGKDDKVLVELEIERASGLKALYQKELGPGTQKIDLSGETLDSGDIVSLYATYLPANTTTLTESDVVASLYGEV